MNEIDVITQDIVIKTEKATETLLPTKSKKVYDKEYDTFQRWMADNSVHIINETVLLEYFKDLAVTFSPNSLWTKYSMLKKTILINKNVDIGNYHILGDDLKQRLKGYAVKKSKVLTREEVLKFIHGAPNETFLMVKVALLFRVFGGCRQQELVNMLVNHVDDRGSVIVVNVPETKTDKKRVFTIIDEKEMNSLKLIKEYATIRPQACSEKRFFLNYRQGRCTGQPVGKNTFGKIPSIIAKYLGLSDADKYTGHCLGRTSATLLVDTRASTTMLKRNGEWKDMAKRYLENSIRSKIINSRTVSGMTSSTDAYSLQELSNSMNECDIQIANNRSTLTAESQEVIDAKCKESNFFRLVTAYRQHGHKCSNINPVSLSTSRSLIPELEIRRYGFKENDKVQFENIIHSSQREGSIKEAVDILNNIYCSSIGAEYLHLENEEEIEWMQEQIEKLPDLDLSDISKINIATDLLKSQCFDQFMAKKFSSVKRYGGEGAESMMAFFSEIFKLSAEETIEQIVLAMPHRGRLNLLTGLLNFPAAGVFNKLKGNPEHPQHYKSTGDVLSHFISSTDLTYNDQSVHISLLYNPSHLEAVNPVSMGKTRAKQMMSKDGDYGNRKWSDKILNIQVHGDAAIIGQGINQECLGLTGVPNFEIGGSIHLVVNNQVGFTTPGDRGRSSRYCTDLAKIIAAPVIHVNGDYPENVLKVTKLAFDYQRRFRKEIFIDLNCYRQLGHNELDNPSFTNPSLYSIINSRRTVPDTYVEKLINENIMTEEDRKNIVEEHEKWLNDELNEAENYEPLDTYFKKEWEGFGQPGDVICTWDTGIDTDVMTFIGTKSVQIPENFEIHPTLLKSHVKNRTNKISEGINIDWATAEALAFGSLLFQGYNVRISGQDVGRGTFSQRHAMLVDQKTNNIYIPLNNMHDNQTGFLEVANSILSEEAVLGYEYGMSIEDPKNLIIWEAQFGDFFNGAQIIFDTFVSSGETKWLWQSGLTVLLPHGYDGAGPEHSSCRLERFLQMTDSKEDEVDGEDVNMQVCQPSTPAQYFHLLRRQMVRNFRKPLIVVTPKILLRHPDCVSDFVDMEPGTFFKPVLGDSMVVPSKVKKILVTSGKHYYSLLERRGSTGVTDTAIISIESFCPFPTMELRQEISKYPEANVTIWCQEEPRNMGAWNFIKPRFENLIGKRIRYCGRETRATPAVGVGILHQREVTDIITKPFLLTK